MCTSLIYIFHQTTSNSSHRPKGWFFIANSGAWSKSFSLFPSFPMRTTVEREAGKSTKFTKLIALALKKTSCSSESRGASLAIIFVSNLRSCYPSLLNYNPLVCVNETHDIFTESRKLSRVENIKFLPWFQRSHGHKYRPESNKSTVLIGYFTWRVESAGNSCNYHAWPPTRLGPSVLPAQVDTLSLY